jgi:hypothetical protein
MATLLFSLLRLLELEFKNRICVSPISTACPRTGIWAAGPPAAARFLDDNIPWPGAYARAKQ